MGGSSFDKEQKGNGFDSWASTKAVWLQFMQTPDPSTSRKSLWKALRSTEAGFGGRLLLPLSVASLVSGGLFILWFGLSFIFSDSGYGGRTRVRMMFDDEVGIVAISILAGLVFIGLLFVTFPWALIMRLIRSLWFWGAAGVTVFISIVTIVLCIVADEMFSGDEEVLMFGFCLLATGVVLTMWVFVGNRLAGPETLASSTETQENDPKIWERSSDRAQ